jgi:hypothetical protein
MFVFSHLPEASEKDQSRLCQEAKPFITKARNVESTKKVFFPSINGFISSFRTLMFSLFCLFKHEHEDSNTLKHKHHNEKCLHSRGMIPFCLSSGKAKNILLVLLIPGPDLIY